MRCRHTARVNFITREVINLKKTPRELYTMSEKMKPFFKKLSEGESLSEAEAMDAFEVLMSGQATDVQIGAFLMGLRVRGVTVEEITGAARIMREKALGVHAPEGAVDTCEIGRAHV